jgi:hypothetical protein
LAFWGCAEDEEVPNEPAPHTPTTVVNFAVDNQTLAEGGDPLKVNLTFDKAAAANGSFSIRLSGNALYSQNFSTSPAATDGIITLPVEKGQTAAFITVTPVDDEDSVGNTTVTVTLENPTAGFKLGSKITSSVELVEDDPGPGNGAVATIEFGENFVHISESDVAGFDISMLLQGNVAHTEIVTIDILPTEGFVYGTDYITDPIAVQNSMKVEINPGTEDIKFKVVPINDQLLSGSFELQFSIIHITDGLQKGAQDSFTMKIEEDDVIDPLEIYTIADSRHGKSVFQFQ